ncbi:MAG: deoxyribodipyrimidine photo-lyase [Pseudomonadota bacterium]
MSEHSLYSAKPTLLWLRRDLRLGDHPGWQAALAGGGPVVPFFVLDPFVEAQYGAAPLWRLGLSLGALGEQLVSRGSRLILRRGDALTALRALIAETGADRVIWSRCYDRASIDRDTAIKAALREDGIDAISVNASLLFEPWTVETRTGGFYKVYTPYWKAVRTGDPGEPLPVPADLRPPESWPRSERLEDWDLGRRMGRGASIVSAHVQVGEARAETRLERFLDTAIARYAAERDRPDIDATSGLSENLTYGEISPRRIWTAGRAAMERLSGPAEEGAETFLKELVWREFSYHLLYHTPEIAERNWRPEWDSFPWRGESPDAEAWRRGMTGYEMVDAGLREMYVTGRMHNRVRMLTASLLTKHLMTHWQIGEAWFRECLVDWDIAANAMGWQWAAGSGPDAAPYFRVFNPITQAEKFDKNATYRNRFLAEGRTRPHQEALAFFEAVPRSWGLSPGAAYPAPIVGHQEGRERALEAYRNRAGAGPAGVTTGVSTA